MLYNSSPPGGHSLSRPDLKIAQELTASETVLSQEDKMFNIETICGGGVAEKERLR